MPLPQPFCYIICPMLARGVGLSKNTLARALFRSWRRRRQWAIASAASSCSSTAISSRQSRQTPPQAATASRSDVRYSPLVKSTSLTRCVVLLLLLVLHHSQFCRFLSYAENRDLVRDILQNNGFKKVKLTMERCAREFLFAFFDLLLVRVSMAPAVGSTDESNIIYEQRPAISLSWEKVRDRELAETIC